MHTLVKIDRIKINKQNDRHGELPDEKAAIAWLFQNQNSQMKKLAKNIALEGRIVEPPLLLENDGEYVLMDGNRRVTCLKIFSNPDLAPNENIRDYFKALKEQHNFLLPVEIECRVESNAELVNHIIQGRHLGSQGGVGVSPWDDRMKQQFERRTGVRDNDTAADFIERLLISKGKKETSYKIKRSIANRLFSSNRQLNRVGISKKGKNFSFDESKIDVLDKLSRIADDFERGVKKLPDVWDNEKKDEYLDEVMSGKPPGNGSQNVPQTARRTGGANGGSAYLRNHLIPGNHFLPEYAQDNQKISYIWRELSQGLKFDRNNISISLMLRVLIELSVEIYMREKEISGKDTLSSNVRLCLENMRDDGSLTGNQFEDIGRMTRNEQLISIRTLQRLAHSEEIVPSPSHLISFWDNIHIFIRNCLK